MSEVVLGLGLQFIHLQGFGVFLAFSAEDFELLHSVPVLHASFDPEVFGESGVLLVYEPVHHVLQMAFLKALRKGQDGDGFDEIGFALTVIPDKDEGVCVWKFEIEQGVVLEVLELEASDSHAHEKRYRVYSEEG